jgi:hypothetical protein
MATQPKSPGPEAPAPPSSADPVEPRPLAFLACPNPDCPSFNVFGAGNLSVAEHLGKNKAIRRLYCNVCHGRFSERQGSLLEDSKLPPADVVRIVKCFGYGLLEKSIRKGARRGGVIEGEKRRKGDHRI